MSPTNLPIFSTNSERETSSTVPTTGPRPTESARLGPGSTIGSGQAVGPEAFSHDTQSQRTKIGGQVEPAASAAVYARKLETGSDIDSNTTVGHELRLRPRPSFSHHPVLSGRLGPTASPRDGGNSSPSPQRTSRKPTLSPCPPTKEKPVDMRGLGN